jgi:hypothetical protein
MMKKLLHGFSIAAISITGFTIAPFAVLAKPSQARPPAQVPGLYPELDQLQYFQGTWTCKSREVSSFTSGQQADITWSVRPDLNGFWYLGREEEKLLAPGAIPLKKSEFMGYNPASKKFVRTIVVSNGNLIEFTSSGWKEDQLVWEGSLVEIAQKRSLRQTFVKKSPSEFEVTYYTKKGDSWQPAFQQICSKPF